MTDPTTPPVADILDSVIPRRFILAQCAEVKITESNVNNLSLADKRDLLRTMAIILQAQRPQSMNMAIIRGTPAPSTDLP